MLNLHYKLMLFAGYGTGRPDENDIRDHMHGDPAAMAHTGGPPPYSQSNDTSGLNREDESRPDKPGYDTSEDRQQRAPGDEVRTRFYY